MIKKKIGFIGVGRMAETLINGMIKSNVATVGDINVSDKDKLRMAYMNEEYHVNAAKTNVSLVEKSDIIIIAVKPNNMSEVLEEIGDAVNEKKLIISIAAGINEEFIRQRLPWDVQVQIVRVMPNTPALVLQGATGMYFNENCNKKNKENAKKIFDSVGISFVFENETYIDAVTALSGSGPAYVFYFIEALSDAGVSIGLNREISQKLAVQTVFGAAQMSKEINAHPTILKELVTSPGGTTIKALGVLERDGVKGSIIDAVNEAYEVSKELSKG